MWPSAINRWLQVKEISEKDPTTTISNFYEGNLTLHMLIEEHEGSMNFSHEDFSTGKHIEYAPMTLKVIPALFRPEPIPSRYSYWERNHAEIKFYGKF